MKYVRRLGLTLLTFIIGVAVSPIRFYRGASIRGKLFDGGGYFGNTVYTSSYFIKLWFVHEQYVSPEKANQVLNQRLSEAVRVIEVGPMINAEGHVVGRRAVALFFEPEVSRYYTAIFWTDGRILHFTLSTSALHAKEFEKRHR